MNQPPNYSDDFIDLRQYGSVLWRWKWLLILGAILAGTAAFITSRLMTPVYAASTTVLINAASDSQLNDYSALLMSERLARTYAEMLSNHPVLEETLAELELEMDLEDLERAVEVNPLRDTQLIVLTVEHTNPFRAADIANTLVEVFVKANDLRQQSRFAVSKASLQAQLERLDKQIEETESAIEEIGEPIGAEEKAEYDRLQL